MDNLENKIRLERVALAKLGAPHSVLSALETWAEETAEALLMDTLPIVLCACGNETFTTQGTRQGDITRNEKRNILCCTKCQKQSVLIIQAR